MALELELEHARLPAGHLMTLYPVLKCFPLAFIILQWRAYVARKAARRGIIDSFQPRRHARIRRECIAAWQVR